MMKTVPPFCTGCRICEMICSITHEGGIAPKRSRIRIRSNWPDEEKIHLCVACEPKPCIGACPEGSLSWEGYLRLNEEKCTACYLCTEACPYEGIRTEPTKRYPLFCDTCEGKFECVQWCPTKAVVKVE